MAWEKLLTGPALLTAKVDGVKFGVYHNLAGSYTVTSYGWCVASKIHYDVKDSALAARVLVEQCVASMKRT